LPLCFLPLLLTLLPALQLCHVGMLTKPWLLVSCLLQEAKARVAAGSSREHSLTPPPPAAASAVP
jgi:hypothetical protein